MLPVCPASIGGSRESDYSAWVSRGGQRLVGVIGYDEGTTMSQGRVRPHADVLALTVHGPAGALDLVVPAGAVVTDVAREYAVQAGLSAIPLLFSRTGGLLLASASLTDVGVGTGDILVAAAGVHRGSVAVPPQSTGPDRSSVSAVAVLWCTVTAAVAVLAGWCAAHASATDRDLATAVLAATALLGLVPAGRHAVPRVLAAPCFLGAAAFAWVWDPAPERLPMVVGVTAAGVAVGAAVVRAVAARAEAQLRVVVVAGTLVFAVTGVVTLMGWAPRVAWAVLLVGALLAARFVPAVAVEVPDQYLVDFERLAVTAWSARDRGPRRRVRSIVPIGAVAEVADRGAHLLAAATASILVAALVTAPLLLGAASLPVDRIGARLEVALVGAGLLLAGRSYRQPAARVQLRLAGLACWAALAAYAVPLLSAGQLLTLSLTAVGLGVVVVVVAMATGHGWRSAWWSRRAEVAEALSGSAALAVVLVSSGVFRQLWEMTS